MNTNTIDIKSLLISEIVLLMNTIMMCEVRVFVVLVVYVVISINYQQDNNTAPPNRMRNAELQDNLNEIRRQEQTV